MNILQYESTVWRTADLLIGAGIKQSDFPKYMMPFFALIMVESRLVRNIREVEKEIDREEELEDFIEEFKELGKGYNALLVEQDKSLKKIAKNDKSFDIDFDAYLKAFDAETRSLLGVDKGNEEEKYLDISGICGQLKKKKILFATVKAWADIDLVPFNNSEITTLEEHIKRKWADISAETAGEQYTPDDIISLIAEIITDKVQDSDDYLTLYDPTCGGGNLLFGVEDKIHKKYERKIKTFGQDWSDSLYALAKIESRFRPDSQIEYGNTLTDLKFIDKQFDVVVANPPYGVDWKGFASDIKQDVTGRFIDKPSISDGQFLFTQHILHQLNDDNGLAVVVHNGSTLFSGDAGSGESNIRRYFFEKDWVEAIIQMPTDEFFNTGIYTYLWVFNKNKAEDRADRVMLINGADLFQLLKKSKGKKRKEMTLDNRSAIVEALRNFETTEFAKVYNKWHFYFNKQAITLTNVDINGKSFEQQLPTKTKNGELVRDKSIKLKPTAIRTMDEETGKEILAFDQFEITTFDASLAESLEEYYKEVLKPQVDALDYKEGKLWIETDKATYSFGTFRNTIVEQTGIEENDLGCGKIQIKAALKKATKTKGARIEITAELFPDYQKDYEIVPFVPHAEANQEGIDQFMEKYVSKPFVYNDNVIGAEVNFNKEFFKASKSRDVNTITAELASLNKDLIKIEKELNL